MKKVLLLSLLFVLFLAGCNGIEPPKGVEPVTRTMIVTGYCSCGKCCSWKRNWLFQPVYMSGPNKGKRKKVGVTASGTQARRGTIAADTKRYPFGTIMYVEGYGFCRVEDRGGAVKGDHIDLFFNTHKSAGNWGKKKIKVKVWFVPKSR